MTFSSINISTGARLSMAAPASPTHRSVLITSSLNSRSIQRSVYTSTLDLSGNDLVLHVGSLSATTAEIASRHLPPSVDSNWLGFRNHIRCCRW